EQRDLDGLASLIDATMPKGNPDACNAKCSRDVAAYILSGFASQPMASCAAQPAGPRVLRLLTRTEYANTVRDLLGSCTLTTFTLAGNHHQWTHVQVAGDFNGWSGWDMPYDSSSDRYLLRHELTPGTHPYKLIADGTWMQDPANSATAPDGFGGNNSVLNVACQAPVALPPETRPSGFAYDDNATASEVTDVHVDAYLASGAQLAANVTGGADFVKTFGPRAFRD